MSSQRNIDSRLYTLLTSEHRKAIANLLPPDSLFSEQEVLEQYSRDYTEDLQFFPEVVVKPRQTEEVSSLLRYCNQHRIPVTVAGGRTGLSGGMLPVYGGVLLSTERMNRIVKVDTRSLFMVVEPGVITQKIHEVAMASQLYYPVDPASMGSCTIGGNIAENSAGPHSFKYGPTGHYVLGLECVLPDGTVVHTGSYTTKNVAGYNLTQLIVGSEGTLAVITKAILKLIPLPTYQVLAVAAFRTLEDAALAISTLLRHHLFPAAIEFMEKDAIEIAQNYLKTFLVPTHACEGLLFIEYDGDDLDQLRKSLEKTYQILEESFSLVDYWVAEAPDEQAALWRIRRVIGEAVKFQSPYKEEDCVVPRAEIPTLVRFVKELEKAYGFQSVVYGHGGDGNLHVNILKNDLSDAQWNELLPKAIHRLFARVIELGGTITGEHGIGYVQKPYFTSLMPTATIHLTRAIKKVFDPNGILNPGKIVD